MTVKVRFAPSPTGKLHVGNARTAIITWLFARSEDGSFLLRIDDTDTERSKDEHTEGIKTNLKWLGMDWDEYAHQRDRTDKYDTAIQSLKDNGRLYPCHETPEELGLKRKAQLSRGQPPIYDRSALQLSDEQKAKFEAEGRKPHWRFLLEHDTIEWDDLVRGTQKFEGKDLSDPVLIREDGRPLYHICSVVDDIEFGITHIIRGEDHVTNSAAHKQMFEALGAKAPTMAHLPLISDLGGGKLSKRLGSLGLNDLREEDRLEPMAVVSYMARLGSSDPIEPFINVEPLIKSFDFSKFSRSTPKFDPAELLRLNSRILHETPFDDVKDRLPDDMTEEFWNAVRANLERVDDARIWWDVTYGNIEPVIEEPEFIDQALAHLPEEPWNEGTWREWTDKLKLETGRKGKQLFMPLRKALTGMSRGPELAPLLPLMGRDRVIRRLEHKKAA